LDDGIKADGSEVRFGPNPIGMVVFAADGHYSLQIIYPFSVTGAIMEMTVSPSDSRKSASCESAKAASGAYGPLPFALFEEIRPKFVAAINARWASVVPRSDE
jgi:hypothetical protein